MLRKFMTEAVERQLLSGSKIIDYYLPTNKKSISNGYILIEYSIPIQEEGDDRTFYFAKYGIYSLSRKPFFYLATQYIKLRRKEVIARAKRRD